MKNARWLTFMAAAVVFVAAWLIDERLAVRIHLVTGGAGTVAMYWNGVLDSCPISGPISL